MNLISKKISCVFSRFQTSYNNRFFPNLTPLEIQPVPANYAKLSSKAASPHNHS